MLGATSETWHFHIFKDCNSKANADGNVAMVQAEAEG
jgi:hypothetical protein